MYQSDWMWGNDWLDWQEEEVTCVKKVRKNKNKNLQASGSKQPSFSFTFIKSWFVKQDRRKKQLVGFLDCVHTSVRSLNILLPNYSTFVESLLIKADFFLLLFFWNIDHLQCWPHSPPWKNAWNMTCVQWRPLRSLQFLLDLLPAVERNICAWESRRGNEHTGLRYLKSRLIYNHVNGGQVSVFSLSFFLLNKVKLRRLDAGRCQKMNK